MANTIKRGESLFIPWIIYGVKGWSVETWNVGTIPAKEIGKKLFFTKEEAEAALPQPPKEG